MRSERRPNIFRETAVRRYLEGREKEILPRFVSPRGFVFLWILFGLLLAATIGIASLIEIPTYAPGTAALVDRRGEADRPVIVVFLPSEHHNDLQKDGRMVLYAGPTGEGLIHSLTRVEPEVLGPEAVNDRFVLDAAERASITGPSAVATAPLRQTSMALADNVAYRTRVEVGSRPVISVLVARDFSGDGA